MIEKLSYPKMFLSVEKSLRDIALDHFKKMEIPQRRVDIICFSKKTTGPLLLIECKNQVINDKTIRQVVGYNYYVQAPFIAMATQKDIVLGAYHSLEKTYKFHKGLLTYNQLEDLI